VTRVNLTFALHALLRASSRWRLRLRPESRRNETGGSVQAPRTDLLSDGPGLLAVANVTLELPPCSTRTVTKHPLTPAATHRVRHVGINRVQTGRGRHQYVSSVEAKDRLSHGRVVPRVSLTGKGPGASVAEYPLYVRAGKGRERERDPRKGPLRHPLDTPAPLVSVDSVFVCLGVARLCVCAASRALHVVSPRDLWSCVLPGWQFNVNVNVSVKRVQ
jgi:hypothetical protein